MGSGFFSFFSIFQNQRIWTVPGFLKKIRFKEPPISSYFKTLREMMVLMQEPKVL
jgi:hypothetical protein